MAVSLVVFCGLPASGKTTLAHCLSEHLGADEKVTRVLIVSYDELMPPDIERSVLENKSSKASWKLYRKSILLCVESLVNFITGNGNKSISELHALDHIDPGLWQRFLESFTRSMPSSIGFDFTTIIIDDNMYYRSMRYDYYQLARKYHTSFCQVHVSCHPALAIERNHLRQHLVPIGVIENMSEKMEAPDPDTLAWEKFSVTVTSEKTNVEAIISLIKAARLEPVTSLPEEDGDGKIESKRRCSESIVHQADQILRKLVSQTMLSFKESGSSNSDMKVYARVVNSARCEILDAMKLGDIFIPVHMDVSDSSKYWDSNLFRFVEGLFQDKITDTVPHS